MTDIDLRNLTTAQGFSILGAEANDHAGVSVSSAGDINGDLINDVIIGAYFASPSSRTNAGTAYVIYGKTSGLTDIDLLSLTSEQGFRILGAASSDYAGASVSSARDINGDGINDVIVGVPNASPSGRFCAGTSYVIYGEVVPTSSPTSTPSSSPTLSPTSIPTTNNPATTPTTMVPTEIPTAFPTLSPTSVPTTTSSSKIYGIAIGVGVSTGLIAGLYALHKCRNKFAQEDLPPPYAPINADNANIIKNNIKPSNIVPDKDKNKIPTSMMAPIGLALSNNKIGLASLDTSNVSFDYHDNGIKTKTSWVGSQDAFLVYDHNDNKQVDAAKELVLTKWSKTATTDFEALKEVFDSNKDNKFNENDAEFHKFVIWQDKNQDGISQRIELTLLPDSGLLEIDFNTEKTLHDEFFGEQQDMNIAEASWMDGYKTLAYDLTLECAVMHM